jgi:hypothetical protein
MTARISRDFDFQAGIYINNEFFMNLYEVDIQFTVETEDIREQNIALDRIKHFLYNCVEHSVLIQQDEKKIEKFVDAGLRVCTLPEEPYDQIVGIMLMTKINSIAEGRLIATDIQIGSKLSDNVVCYFSVEENIGPFNELGWWHDASTKISGNITKNKKIVKLSKPNSDWEQLYLGWNQSPQTFVVDSPSNEVVFANFEPKTDK